MVGCGNLDLIVGGDPKGLKFLGRRIRKFSGNL
jgi:hypothetical protein